MDFELTRDQEDLRDGLRKLLAGRFPIEQVRTLEAVGGIDRSLWRELAEAGVFSLRATEAEGGVGLGMAEAVLVFEELGRALVPGPLVATHLSTRPGIVGVVERARPAAVEYLEHLDRLVVLDDDGVWEIDPTTVVADAVPTPLDPLTPVTFVRDLPRGEQCGDIATAERMRVEGTVLSAALLLGIAGVVTEQAVAYALDREQFGRPIGSFQAVKHLLADMFTRAETARAAVYAAGVTVDDPIVGDPARAAAVAKIVAGDAAVANGKACIQVHGGMGFTWEVDAHLYLKRAWVLETHFGSGDEHAETLAQQFHG